MTTNKSGEGDHKTVSRGISHRCKGKPWTGGGAVPVRCAPCLVAALKARLLERDIQPDNGSGATLFHKVDPATGHFLATAAHDNDFMPILGDLCHRVNKQRCGAADAASTTDGDDNDRLLELNYSQFEKCRIFLKEVSLSCLCVCVCCVTFNC